MQGATGGAVIPFERAGTPAVNKEEYTEAIRLWCRDRSIAEALSREEIGDLQAFDRVDAQRKAMIIGFAHYLRENPRSDVAMGVYLVLTLLSDNENGCASVSQPTLAKMFGRSVSSIGDAQRRLKEHGLIVMGRGRYAGTYPVIPRAVTQHRNHLTWLIAALAEQAKPAKLPAPPVDCQSTDPAGGLDQSTDQPSGLNSVNQPVEDDSINRPGRCQLHYKNSAMLLKSASEREEDGSSPLKIAATIAMGVLAGASSVLPAAARSADPPPIQQASQLSLADMSERLMDVAGSALANPANSPGLLMYGEIKRWLDDGCDFEIDILPTINAVATRHRQRGSKPITAWSYFTTAVAEAKATRLRPMPAVRTAPVGSSREWHDKQDAALEYLFRK